VSRLKADGWRRPTEAESNATTPRQEMNLPSPASSNPDHDLPPYTSSDINFSANRPFSHKRLPKGQINTLLSATSDGFAWGPGREQADITAQARLVKLDKHQGANVLLVTIGGRDLVVLPGGKVLVESRFGEAKVYELGERLPPSSSTTPLRKEKGFPFSWATSSQHDSSVSITL
jgi:hypothetical protein